MKPVTISFVSLSKLNEIADGMTADLNLIHNNQTYPVNSFVASRFSRKIYYSLLEDVCQTEIVVNTPGTNFEEIQQYLMAKEIQITPQNVFVLFNYACELQMQSLIDKLIPVLISQISLQSESNVSYFVDLIQFAFGFNVNYSLLIGPVAQNFSLFVKFLNKLPDPVIDSILSSIELSASDEDIFNFLTHRVDFNKNPNNRLLKHIPVQYFNESHPFSKILDNPLLNMNTLRTVLLKLKFVTEMPKIEDEDATVSGEDTQNSENIPKRSNKLEDKNIYVGLSLTTGLISRGIRKPIVFSYPPAITGYEIDNMFDETDSFFCTKLYSQSVDYSNSISSPKYRQMISNLPKGYPYIVFDFEDPTCVNGIVIQSFNMASNGVAPTSWTFEGSHDGFEWTLLTSVQNNTSLVGPAKCNYFSITNTNYYVYYKFTQQSTSNPGNSALAIRYLDFFGSIP